MMQGPILKKNLKGNKAKNYFVTSENATKKNTGTSPPAIGNKINLTLSPVLENTIAVPRNITTGIANIIIIDIYTA